MLVRHASRRVARPLASYARAMSTTKYRTTRGAQKDVDFASAVLQGLGSDGGLFVPQDLPKISAAELESWRSATYEDVAYGVMSKYITEDVMPAAKLKDIIKRSYGTFRPPSDDPITPGDHTDGKHGRVTPVRELPGDNMHVLELYHGPTFAFKDVALQVLGNLFEALLEDRPGMRITVLGATSGDTGSSAIHGLRGKKNVECFIMYPEGRTSRTQELQMITVRGAPRVLRAILSGAALGAQFSGALPRNFLTPPPAPLSGDRPEHPQHLPARHLRRLPGDREGVVQRQSVPRPQPARRGQLDQLGAHPRAAGVLRVRVPPRDGGGRRDGGEEGVVHRADRQLWRHPRRVLREAHGAPGRPDGGGDQP